MTKSSKVLLAAATACALWNLRQPAFLPPPGCMAMPTAGVALLGASPAISDAAKELGTVSYQAAREVDWNSGLYFQYPKLLKAAADAHHKAIGSIGDAHAVTPQADWDVVNAALGRVIASVPACTVMPSGDHLRPLHQATSWCLDYSGR
mmetsp:Transcript_15262/g.32096  ORF Transcript_15262/g.32096 Transcript_15262/m.32096 type:complete len:149 (-) Transcript_15262:343-789(-)